MAGAEDRIIVRTSVVELGLYGEAYDAFADALREKGYEVVIEDPEEYRSLGRIAGEVGIFILMYGGTKVLDALYAAARDTISQRKRGRRTQQLRRLPVREGDETVGYIELPAESESPERHRQGGRGTPS